METNEPRYGLVRAGGKTDEAWYDIVFHSPGHSDVIIARRALYGHGMTIVEALNTTLRTNEEGV